MADEKENPASATAMPRVRRRAPTIELKATEVAIEPPPSPMADPPVAEAGNVQPPDYPTEPPAYETGRAEPPPEPPETPKQKNPGPSFLSLPLVGAGLAGGLVALLVIVLMWLGGVFSSGDTSADPRVSRIETQLRDLTGRAVQPAPDNRAIDDLKARIAGLENAPRVDKNAVAGNADETIKTLQAAVAELARRADDNAATIRELRSQADAARSSADAARLAAEKNNVEGVSNRVAALEQTARTLNEEVAKSLTAVGGDKPLRAVVAAQALRDAVERGSPFAAELVAGKAVASNPQMLAPLESFAAAGLPGGALLARQLSEIAPAMLKLAAPPQPSGGFLDRLQANAEKLVRVRPIDEQPGDDPAAVISRAQAKAARSDLAGALAEMKALPPGVRAPAEDWIKKVEAREAAVNASRRLVADALAGLGKATP